MGKNKEEQARREGADYAIRMVKLHGIEWTEADLKKRGAYNIVAARIGRVRGTYKDDVP